MASGDTKTEAMLNVLGNGGSGDEFRGCCNTKTQSYILDAIDRINSLTPGGSSDFNDLSNRPQLNGTQMTGSTNITNFTGTDGNTAGAQGLVPAPATTDAGKFLKADGTWDTTGGGGGDTVYSDVQTSNDNTGGAVYIGNKNAQQQIIGDPNSTDTHIKYFVALPEYNPNNVPNGAVNILGNTYEFAPVSIGLSSQAGNGGIAIGWGANTRPGEGGVAIGRESYNGYMGSVALGRNATTTRAGEVNVGAGSSSYGYSSSQYRVIGGVYDGQLAHDAVTVGQLNGRIMRGAGAPSASTAAEIGTMYEDTTSASIWYCEGSDDPSEPTEYYWMQIASTDYVDQVQNTLSATAQNGGTTAPTTSTYGEIGTLYSAVVSGVPHVYMCTEYNDVDDEYIWAQIV